MDVFIYWEYCLTTEFKISLNEIYVKRSETLPLFNNFVFTVFMLNFLLDVTEEYV
jgi:hypothetical protein